MDCTENPVVNYLGIFPRSFDNHANVIFPLRGKILQTIIAEIFTPNKTAKAMCTSENLETLTQAKLFPGFGIIWVHNQKYFGGFGVVSTTQSEFF